MKNNNMKRIQNEELQILKKTVCFLEKVNLNYFLCGGTLLGAIRHKGFIPWDDDIDIAMPRNDYEKFILMCKENPYIISDELEVSSYEINGLVKPFCKILNKKIPIKEKNGIDKFIWIDIFPIDGLPKNKAKLKLIYFTEHLYKLFVALKESESINNNGSIKYIIKRAIRIMIKPINTKIFLNRMVAIAKKYKYNESKYVGNVVWGYGPQERIDKKELEIMEVEFEGLKVNGIKGYDKYLTNIYGDYITLPPEEKRVTHNFTIVERD